MSQSPPQREFELELVFSGLCLIWVRQPMPSGSMRPPHGENIEVLFVPAGCHVPHFPRLTYRGRDHQGLLKNSLIQTSHVGEELVAKRLEDCEVTFEMPYPARKETVSQFMWSPRRGSHFPSRPRDDQYLDWILRAQKLGLKEIDPTKAPTRIVLPAGTWTARDVFRNREVPSVRPVLWELGQGGPIRALASDVKLTVQKLWDSPVLSITNSQTHETERICITPSADGVARLAFTNLPETYLPPDSHIGSFTLLAPGGKSPIITVPRQLDDVATMGSECGVMFFFGEDGVTNQPTSPTLAPPPDLPHLESVGAPDAWRKGYLGDLKTKVAVFDTGIDITEGAARRSMGDDIQRPRVRGGWRQSQGSWIDDVGHGTSIASLVGGRYIETIDPRGIVPYVTLANYKIGEPTATSNARVKVSHLLSAIAKLIERNDRGGADGERPTRIAVFSIENVWYRRGGNPIAAEKLNRIRRAFGELRDAGILAVVAAGDERTNLAEHPLRWSDPYGDLQNIVVVGGCNSDFQYSRSAKHNNYKVHIAAPGEEIPAVIPRGGWGLRFGSSAAAALVAGTAAMLVSERQEPTTDPVAWVIKLRDDLLDLNDVKATLSDRVQGSRFLDLSKLPNLPSEAKSVRAEAIRAALIPLPRIPFGGLPQDHDGNVDA